MADDAVADEPMFDASMKKKKKSSKKSVAFADDVDSADPQEEPVGDEEAESMFSDLKKKKKKKPAKEGESGDADIAEVEEQIENMFSDLKKKKKKKSSSQEGLDADADQEEAAEDGGEAADDGETPDFSNLKKPRRKPKKTEAAEAFDPALIKEQLANVGGEETWQDTDRDYTYHELLARVFRIIKQKNPDFAGDRRRYVMVPPQVARDGSKKTVFINLIDICRRMHRSPEHVIAFIFAELGTTGSVDGSQRLIIRGRFQQQQIENILRKYIVEYVQCKTCKSSDTNFRKENRLFFVQCETCGSSRAVSAIKSGFRAQTEKRRLARQ